MTLVVFKILRDIDILAEKATTGSEAHHEPETFMTKRKLILGQKAREALRFGIPFSLGFKALYK